MKLTRIFLMAVILLTVSCAPTKPVMAAPIDLRSIPIAPVETNTGPRAGRTANYYLMARMDMSMVEPLAKYDVLVLGLENAINNREVLDAIRAKHQDVKMFFYVQSNEFPYGGFQNNEAPGGPWHQLLARLDTTRHFLLDPTGKPAQFWPGTRSYNLTDPDVPRILDGWIGDQLAAYPWDGVFIDNVWTNMEWYCSGNVDSDRNGIKDDMKVFSQKWTANLAWFGQLLRLRLGTTKLLLGNIGGDTGTNHSFWSDVANGRMFEGFPNTLSLPVLSTAYLDTSIPWKRPGCTIVHCEANENEPDKIQFGWFFTLLGNGTFAVDHGPNSGPDGDNGWHDQLRWYPELYERDYGTPVAQAFRDGTSRVWIREYTRGLVTWNPMPTIANLTVILRDGRRIEINVPGHDGQFVPTTN